MDVKDRTFGTMLNNQFKKSWSILRKAIESVPDELLYRMKNDGSIIWEMYHIIETADFYSSDCPDNYPWGKRAGIDWSDKESDPKEKIVKVTKKDLLSFLDEVEEKIDGILLKLQDSQLKETDGFEEHLNCIMTKFLYLLRHNMFHLGKVSQVFRDNNCERLKWK